jgi:hypothetical protein
MEDPIHVLSRHFGQDRELAHIVEVALGLRLLTDARVAWLLDCTPEQLRAMKETHPALRDVLANRISLFKARGCGASRQDRRRQFIRGAAIH